MQKGEIRAVVQKFRNDKYLSISINDQRTILLDYEGDAPHGSDVDVENTLDYRKLLNTAILHFMCLSKQDQCLESVEGILKEGVYIDAKNSSYQTLLTCIVERGNREMVQLLVKYGAAVNPTRSCTDSHRPVMIAVRKKFTDIAELLLDSCTDSLLAKALYAAAEVGNTKIVRYILNKGISPNDPLAWEPLNKSTPLHIAVSNMRVEVVRLLLSFGADLNIKDRFGTPTNGLGSYFSWDLGYESPDDWKILR